MYIQYTQYMTVHLSIPSVDDWTRQTSRVGVSLGFKRLINHTRAHVDRLLFLGGQATFVTLPLGAKHIFFFL